MKKIIVAAALVALTGCTTNQRLIIGTAVVSSIILSSGHAHRDRAPDAIGDPGALPCHPQPDGSCR